jgi:hypothetical protein
MPLRIVLTLIAALSAGIASADDAYKLSKVDQLPEGLAEKVAAVIDPAGYRITGEDGPVAEIFFAKKLTLEKDFEPTLNISYALTPGQLVGALHVPKGATYTDFRGQELSPGMYTLRYGRQPVDGNHIGTSETHDFLLALSAKKDADPAPIADARQLMMNSAAAVGSTHPAIYSLLPTKAPAKQAGLEHDDNFDFWILNANASGAAGDGEKAKPVPFRMVVIGQSEA